MKIYLTLFFAVIVSFTANSQIINICGTDTIILELQNYSDGIIQWEMSENDTVNWVEIDGETGLTYKFLPTEQKFYRAKIYTTECNPIYSPYSFVQLTPAANAGSDRRCGTNEINLKGNEQIGATGTWSVIYGKGTFDDITSRNSKFTVNDGDSVSLVWTLTNSCGSSSDTVNLVFDELKSISEDSIIIVDITDTLYSTFEEMADGFYKVKFSDSEILPSENIYLIGIRDDINFLVKVKSFTLQNGIYTFITEQAQLEDIFTSGTFNMGEAVNLSLMADDRKAAAMPEKFPTRETFRTYTNNKGITPLYTMSKYDRRYPEMKNKTVNNSAKGFTIPIPSIPIYESDNVTLSIEDAYISIDPNFVLDFRINWFSLDYIKVGVENSGFEYGYNTILEVSGSETLSDWEKSLYETSKISYFMAGSVPVVVETKFDITASFGAEVSGAVTFERTLVNNRTLTAYLEGKPGNFNTVYSSTNTKTDDFNFSAEGHISAELAITPSISFKAYGVVGPYLEVPLTASADACMDFTTGNWTATAGLGISGNLGARGEILGNKIFDFNQEIFNNSIGDEIVIPDKIELISGYNQLGNKNSLLAKPIVLRVKSSLGFPVPFFPVRVELTDGNGSSDNEFYMSDVFGNVSINWTIGTNNKNVMSLYANDCDGEYLNNTPLHVIAYTPEYISDCNNSNIRIVVTISKAQQTIKCYAAGGYPPYQYSTDGINWSSQVPYFSYFEAGNFIIYAKDIYDCIASRSFTVQPGDYCKNNNLVLNYTQVGTNVTLNATGGYPPYKYSWGDQSNFGTNQFFNNLLPGTYLAYVQDNRGCQKSKSITIPISAIDPLQAIFPKDLEQNVAVENLVFIWNSGAYANKQKFDLYLKTNSTNYNLIALNLIEPNYIYQQNLTNSTDYTWKVVVKNEIGTEIHYKEFSFGTIDEAPAVPQIPIIIQPLNASVIDTLTYTFAWEPQNEMIYNFYCDTIDGSALNATNLNLSEFKVEHLHNFSDYFWKVAVKNPATSMVAVSPVYQFTTDTIQIPDVVLVSPSNNLVCTSSSVVLSWNNLGAYYNYTVYFDKTDASTIHLQNITDSSVLIENLTDLTTYKWKIVATNTLCNRSNSSEVYSFFTGFTETVFDRDSNSYSTVIINKKKCFQENLKTTKFSDGTPIADGTGIGNYYADSAPQYYFNFNDDVANVAVYGRLYTWYTVTDDKNVCPTGWHVTSNAEIGELMNGYNGGNFKEAGTTHWSEPNTGADNLSNFTALPSGARYSYGFNWLHSYGIYWNTNEYDDTYAGCYQLIYNDATLWYASGEKKAGFSVRCVKN